MRFIRAALICLVMFAVASTTINLPWEIGHGWDIGMLTDDPRFNCELLVTGGYVEHDLIGQGPNSICQ